MTEPNFTFKCNVCKMQWKIDRAGQTKNGESICDILQYHVVMRECEKKC